MCKICEDAMATAKQVGLATPDAWEKADAAIKAWRAANPDLEFDGVIAEGEAWAAHMAASDKGGLAMNEIGHTSTAALSKPLPPPPADGETT